MMELPPSVPSLSPAEMQILVSRTGLVLNPGQVADLVLAWRQVAMLINSIPRDRPLVDDIALRFRLPSPKSQAGNAAQESAAGRQTVKASSRRVSAPSPGKPKPSVRGTSPSAGRPADPKAGKATLSPARGARGSRQRASVGSKPRR